MVLRHRESFERVCQLRSREIDPKLFNTIASFAEANNLSFLKAVEIYSEAVARSVMPGSGAALAHYPHDESRKFATS